MTNDQAIAIVAERLMGWTVCRNPECGCYDCKAELWENDSGQLMKRYTVEPWNPFDDCNADYAVLQAVREKWACTDSKIRSFQNWLRRQWSGASIMFEVCYRPGDYCLAAAKVLEEA